MADWAVFLLLGLLVPLIVNEIGEVAGWLAIRVLTWGARRLGSIQAAERYSEEWSADLERIPGKLTKLGYALSTVALSVPQLRRQFRRQRKKRERLASQHGVARGGANGLRPRSWDGLVGTARTTACLIEAKSGSRLALDALVADLVPITWHVARAQHLSRDTAEDVVQSVWLRLLRSWDGITDARELASWLITNTRKEARHAQSGDADGSSRIDDPSTGALVGEDLVRWYAFHSLPVRDQEILRLERVFEAGDLHVLAAALELSSDGFASAKKEALQALRALIDQVDLDKAP
ncbi:RNA polymerase sigma factor [Saccharothrix sp. NRRL B-16348]|uniref:RNA polymerase sigma factor n=1 Tax=Saccharothrix sp. NRRL B-16348 TaxID=1415542 RepID=UPI000AE2FC11|nr:sigma-70 family RNA polymerase sigma factor [Saccharothrix sp. NRRL B-16348]